LFDLKQAFDLNRNVFIQASAGAGKTWLLSKRYASILNEFARTWVGSGGSRSPDAANILVITFTNKAAAEMAGRIYQDMNQLLKDEPLAGTPEDFGSDLRRVSDDFKMHLRSSFPQNAISTIDAFCARVLRENAQLAGIDPEFRLQDEVDYHRILLESWHGFLAEKSRRHDKDLRKLLEVFSPARLENYVRRIQAKAEILRDWIEAQADLDPVQQRKILQQRFPLPGQMGDIETELRALVRDLPAADSMRNPNDRIFRLLTQLAGDLGSQEDEYFQGLILLEHLAQLCFTSKGDTYLRTVRASRNTWPDENIAVEMRDRRRALVEQARAWFSEDELSHFLNRWDWLAPEYTPALCRFYLEFERRLVKRSKLDGALSFDEVIRRTVDILGDPGVAREYAQRYPHILVDEFQDTNGLRWEVVRRIASAGGSSLRPQGLFLVGDTKQSIYRFNQADVQVMNRVGQVIEATNGACIDNDYTHRSSRSYVETVINPLMQTVFETDNVKDLPSFEAQFRATAVPDTHPMDPERHTKSICNIQVCAPGNILEPAHALQAAYAAKKMLEWLDDKGIRVNQGPAVGILLRSFTRIADYIRTFNKLGLDFEVVASRGLFQQQESYDLFHLISILINPLDDMALTALLRSPFFVWPDVLIQELANKAGPDRASGWVWNTLLHFAPEVYDQIRNWRQLSLSQPVDRLIEQILDEVEERRLGWISEINGPARLANLERLIHYLHKRSLEGQDLRQIYETLKFQIQEGDDSQAELPSTAHIHIMTIHKAKGLEFPGVILPEMERTVRGEHSGLYYWQNPQSQNWEAALTFQSEQGTRRPLLTKNVREADRAAEEAEDKRVFYVAVTRAIHAISFLALEGRGIKDSRSWWKRYVAPGFDLDRLLDGKNYSQSASEWEACSIHEKNIRVERIEAEEVVKYLAGSETPELPVDPGPPKPPAVKGLEEISPHTIMTWVEKNDHFRPLIESRSLEGEDDGFALSFGRLMHKIIEMGWTDLQADHEHIQTYLQEHVATSQHGDLLEELEQCLPNYLNSHLKARLDTLSQEEKFPELPLMGWMEDTTTQYIVNGVLDLLYEFEGRWYLVDYKTDEDPPLEKIRSGRHPYWFQIQTYLWMLKQSYGIDAAASLFFLRHAESSLEITPDPKAYLQHLERERGSCFTVAIPEVLTGESDETLLKHLPENEPFLLVEPTRGNTERRHASLAANGRLIPGSQVLTLQTLKQQLRSPGRRLTPYRARIGAASILGPTSNWGTVNQLAAAFYKASQGWELTAQGQDLHSRFLNWCHDRDIAAPDELLDLTRLKGFTVLVNGHYAITPGDFRFFKELASSQDSSTFIVPTLTGIDAEISHWDEHSWRKVARLPAGQEQLQYHHCFSVQEEVELAARHINGIVAEGVDLQQIHVAVSSPERYVPVIKANFGSHGIPLRISKREPVMERPLTQFIFAFLRLVDLNRPRWEQAASVWLVPFLHGSQEDEILAMQLDAWCRREQVQGVRELLNTDNLPRSLEQARSLFGRFWQLVEKFPDRRNMYTRIERLLEHLDRWEVEQHLHGIDDSAVARSAFSAAIDCLHDIQEHWERFGSSDSLTPDLSRELRNRLENLEVSSASQAFGVEIVSYLETANLETQHLLVLGLTEGQFPLKPDNNPFLTRSEVVPWHLNLSLLNRWLERFPDGLWLSAPERDVDGAALQASTFMEFFKKLKPAFSNSLKPANRRQYLSRLNGQRVSGLEHENDWFRRHELLGHEGLHPYNGAIGEVGAFREISLSATRLDDLIRCPQRFWYARVLQLEPMESSIVPPFDPELGLLVHRLLERFGKRGGFGELADLKVTAGLLEEIRNELLADESLIQREDLISHLRSEPYLDNFDKPELNLISAMLMKEAALLGQFESESYFEQAFGLPDRSGDSWPELVIADTDNSLRMILRGVVDRVVVGPGGVWCVDYKTGGIDLDATRGFWSSQMLVYFLVLKERYPDKSVILNLDQVSGYALGTSGLSDPIGELDPHHPVMSAGLSNNRRSIAIREDGDWSLEGIRKAILDYGSHLKEGTYPLTTRDESRACQYCQFERICRKGSLPR